MVPFCRRVEEARQVIKVMAEHGLELGRNGLEIYVICEIPNNVIQIDACAVEFDGFSIGPNDLTQLTLGVDRVSEIVAFFDERDPGMLEMLRLAVTGAKRNHRHVGIGGEAPATYREIARFLVELGIDSISVNASSLVHTIDLVRETEQGLHSTDVARLGGRIEHSWVDRDRTADRNAYRQPRRRSRLRCRRGSAGTQDPHLRRAV